MLKHLHEQGVTVDIENPDDDDGAYEGSEIQQDGDGDTNRRARVCAHLDQGIDKHGQYQHMLRYQLRIVGVDVHKLFHSLLP